MKTKRMIATLFFIAIIGMMFIVRNSIMSCEKKLMKYEDDIMSQYTSKGLLDNQKQCDEVLDTIEKYISDNRWKLMIRKYVRNPDSITVEFWSGKHYMILPKIKGMK